MYPNFKEEKILWEKGFKFVAGLDEVGRGPLAGPVVAAAVVINVKNYKEVEKLLCGINDSKKLSKIQKEYFYDILINNKDIKWGVGIVSEKIIDKINILQATKLAMLKATNKLDADYLLLDGNFKINSVIYQKSIIKGDQKVTSISAASVIAKVTRDRIMDKYDKKYPQYEFAKHKGYGTKLHMNMIKKFGNCPIHRKSFRGTV
ncbi:MAG: ribonuclease HII [Candidatus Staskawiczbacteria bacterium]